MTTEKKVNSDTKTTNHDFTGADIWLLEDVYPDPNSLLQAIPDLDPNNAAVDVVLDTNVLLLPFNVGGQDLPEIIKAYKNLKNQNRLFIPSRVIREYLKNRDTKLAELLRSLHARNNQLAVPSLDLPTMLRNTPEAKEAMEAASKISETKREYLAKYNALESMIKSWRGNDPVTTAYQDLFSPDLIIDYSLSREELSKKWSERLQRQIPPGYKDAAKADTGIGDFLVWTSILHRATTSKRDLIFVTGEEKSDWLVASTFIRPELLDEYKRASGGKALSIMKLADLLEKMAVPTNVVAEVRQAENDVRTELEEKSALRAWDQPVNRHNRLSPNEDNITSQHSMTELSSQMATFPFSHNNAGRIDLNLFGSLIQFRFVYESDSVIVIKPIDRDVAVAVVGNALPGTRLVGTKFKLGGSVVLSFDDVLVAIVNGFYLAMRLADVHISERKIFVLYSSAPYLSSLRAP